MSDLDVIAQSWPGARAPRSLLRPVPPAPQVRPLEVECMASPLLLPAALDLENLHCDSDPEAKRPASPSLLSTGVEIDLGEEREDILHLGLQKLSLPLAWDLGHLLCDLMWVCCFSMFPGNPSKTCEAL
ncbi:unnamed protein product [Durusdinium trenchii]|uniref:Uncharacterized protein n=1 Tax=Durusdinium trenchii TaxID=1381693 RepID=A0ABP0HB49_9DINO